MTARGGRAEVLVGAVLVIALVALVVLGVDRGLALRDSGRLDDDRTAALEAARAEVLALTTVSADSTDADIDAILEGATKDFRAQFEGQAAAFRKALTDDQVSSRGSIVSSGLTSISSSKAEVLVAATGEVTNTSSKKPIERNYRLRVTLQKVAGAWLVDGMDFVS